MQEVNRAFWRQVVIPLVKRTQQSFAAWLSPLWGEISIEADLDRIDALAGEREMEWRRIGAASFLNDDEKREALEYKAGARKSDCGCGKRGTKYRPDQARDDHGRWVDEGGRATENPSFDQINIDCDSMFHYDLEICNSHFIRQDRWLQGERSKAARLRLDQCENGLELIPLLPMNV